MTGRIDRKNALFAGHDQGAKNWACIVSLIESKLSGVDPQAFFTDVLTRLVDLWPASRIDELTHGPGRPSAPQSGKWRARGRIAQGWASSQRDAL